MQALHSLRAAAPLALLLSAVALSPVRAQTTAVSFAPGFTGIESTAAGEGVASYNLGFSFTVNAPVIVTQLGYFADPSYSPITSRVGGGPQDYQYTTSHDVGIYTASGTLLLSGTVTQADTLDGNFRFAAPSSLPALLLLPGQNYIIAGVTGQYDPFFEDVQTQDGTASALLTAPQVNYGGSVSALGGSLASNNFSASPLSDPGIFRPDFKFRAAPVPEASTLASTGLLLLLGLAGAGVSARRRRPA